MLLHLHEFAFQFLASLSLRFIHSMLYTVSGSVTYGGEIKMSPRIHASVLWGLLSEDVEGNRQLHESNCAAMASSRSARHMGSEELQAGKLDLGRETKRSCFRSSRRQNHWE